MKKTPILAVTMMLTLGSLTPIAHAFEIPSNERAKEITELRANKIKVPKEKDTSNSISEVAPYVHKDDKGFLYVDSNIPRDIYIKNQVDVLEASFEKINMQVANGQVVINDDLSITNKSNFTILASKGYTSETFWWGQRATYTNSQAKTAIQQLENAAIDIGFIGAAIFWLPPLAATAGITGAYCGKLAKSMKEKNKGNGVILDMTWVLAYTVKSR